MRNDFFSYKRIMPIKRLFYLPVLLFSLGSCAQQHKNQPAEIEDGIRIASMADVGIDSTVINKIDTAVSNGTYHNIHSLLIVRNNLLVHERYWPGKDESWGTNLGITIHSKDSLH